MHHSSRSKFLRIFALAILATAMSSTPLISQSEMTVPPRLESSIGVYGGILRGNLDASFNISRAGVVRDGACGRYETGTINGYVVGAFGELPISTLVGFVATAEYDRRISELSYECVDPADTRMPDGTVADAVTEFRATTTFNVIGLSMGATLRPFVLPIVFSLSPTISYCPSARYDAREIIVTPTNASFVDGGGQSRPVGAGTFDAGDVSFGLGAAAWFEARIAERLFLTPRVAGFFGLSDDVAAGSLRARGLDITLGLVYRFPPYTRASTPIEPGVVPAPPSR